MNTGMDSLPKWVEQLRDCHHCINRIVYVWRVDVTFARCYMLATYGISRARFAAMCLQVYKNGRPQTFNDCDFRDEWQDKHGNYYYPLDNSI